MIDRSDQFKQIRKKYGPRFFVKEGYNRECAALWGYDWPCPEVNEHGVFEDDEREKFFLKFDRDWFLEIRGACGANNLWAYGYNYWFSDGGGGCAPSIGDMIAFESFDELKIYYLDHFEKRIKERIASPFVPEAHIPLLKKALEKIQDAKIPQLELF